MSEYTIKQYQKGFEDNQEKIGIEVAKSFLIPHQTNATRLKERYSQEDFDPETRLYAFQGDKMIGFLTSRVLPDDESGEKKASLTPPSVLAGHEPAQKLLLKKAFHILKGKGVQKVQSNFGAYASLDGEVAKKLGYKLVNVNSYVYSIDIENIDTAVSFDAVVDFEFDKHQEQCAKVLASEYGRDIDWANTFYERIKNEENSQRQQFVIYENNELKAYGSINPNFIDPTICGLTVIYAKDKDYMKQMLSKIATVIKEKGFKRLFTSFSEDSDVKEKKYIPIKFDLIGKGSLFEKEL